MGTDTYNGWANRETWLVNLWVNNEPNLSDAVLETVADTVDRVAEQWVPRAAGEAVAELVAGWWDDDASDRMRGLWDDLVGTALARVDWEAVAAPFVAERWEQLSSDL